MNTHSTTTAAPDAAMPADFPIPFYRQGPADDLAESMALFGILDHLFDKGSQHGLSRETVADMATLFSQAREKLTPILRFLREEEENEEKGILDRYRAARRAEVYESWRRGQ